MNLALISKLWERTKVVDSHWLWQGTIKDNGYGTVSYSNGSTYVHRLSLCIYLKLLYTDKWVACHLCEYKNCWNPLHLYQGTQKDNLKDLVRAGKHYETIKTHCPQGHEYTKENTYNNPKGFRQCKTCVYLQSKRRRSKE